MTKIHAPFTSEQVIQLNHWQMRGGMHPFTCGNAHEKEMPLVATIEGWVCADPECGYTQDWAHDFMANWSPPMAEDSAYKAIQDESRVVNALYGMTGSFTMVELAVAAGGEHLRTTATRVLRKRVALGTVEMVSQAKKTRRYRLADD